LVTQSEYCFPTPSLGSHNARKYATKTLTKLDWNNSELINGDVPEGIKRIKKWQAMDGVTKAPLGGKRYGCKSYRQSQMW